MLELLFQIQPMLADFGISAVAMIALALSAAGTVVSMQAQNKAQKAQAEAAAAEMVRQREFQKKAGKVVEDQTAQAGLDRAQPDLNAAAAKRAAAYNRITSQIQQTQPTGTQTVTRTVNNPMATATANQSAMSAAWNKIIGGAQSKLGAYNDWGLARNIAQQRASQDIATIGGDASRSAQISAAEQQDASHAGDSLKATGVILGAAGNMAGAYAAAGGGWGSGVDTSGNVDDLAATGGEAGQSFRSNY